MAAWTRRILYVENPWGYGAEGEEKDEGSPRFQARTSKTRSPLIEMESTGGDRACVLVGLIYEDGCG